MFHPQGPSFFELARQALSSTERGYDLLAPKFDYTPFRTADLFLELTRRYLNSSQNSFAEINSALDVCCGTGTAMEMLLPIANRRVCGIDISSGMLDVATRNLDAAVTGTTPTIEFVQRDVMNMDLTASSIWLFRLEPADIFDRTRNRNLSRRFTMRRSLVDDSCLLPIDFCDSR